MSSLLKLKCEELRKMANDLATEKNIKFKKTVHGKNKTELIKFINSINNENCNIQSESLKNTIANPEFDASKAFLVHDCENVSPIHFDDIIDSPNHSKVEEAIEKCFADKSFEFED
jgi:hypothetical protein